MKPLSSSSPIRTWLLALLIIVVLSMIALVVALEAGQVVKELSPSPTPPFSSEDTVIEGKLTCLPHKDASGPTTLECALGIRTDADAHYALDTTTYDAAIFEQFSMDQSLAVTGAMTPLAQVSDTSIKKYDILGVIHVQNVDKKP